MSISIGTTFNILTQDPLFSVDKLSAGIIVVDNLAVADGHSREFRVNRIYMDRDDLSVRVYDSQGMSYVLKSFATGTDSAEALAQIAKNKQALNRLTSKINSESTDVYTYRGKDVPNIPLDKAYKGYYISLYSLVKNIGEIPIPDRDLPEGTIFSIDNTDRDDSIRVRARAGEKIGGASALNIPPQNLLFLVKTSAAGWQIGFKGFIPDSLASVVSEVSAALPATSQLTIQEIEAQLKDRLHTYREIQTEFSEQLHTIEELRLAGFLQRETDYGFQDGTNVPVDRTWKVGTKSMDSPFTVNTATEANLLLLMPSVVAELIGKILVDGVSKDFTINDFPPNVNDGTQKLLITKDKIPANVDVKIFFAYGFDPSVLPSSGVELTDGTTTVSDIKKINLFGLKITDQNTPGETTIDGGVTIRMSPPEQQFGMSNAIDIEVVPPLRTYENETPGVQGVKLELKPGTFEPMQAPGMLIYAKSNLEILGKHGATNVYHRGALWLDDVVVPSGPYIYTNIISKAYGIQEYDDGDPNVTGGNDFLVIWRVAMVGKALEEGFVRVGLTNVAAVPTDPNDGFLLDKKGKPMVVERHYKKDETLGVLEVRGIVNAKGLKEFKAMAMDNFATDVLVIGDRTEGGTGLMIQAISKDAKTGNALQQFELDTKQNIEISPYYLGPGRADLTYIINYDQPISRGEAGEGTTMNDGWGMYNLTPLNFGVVSGHVLFQDDNEETDFNLHRIFDSEETQLLRSKEVVVTVTSQNNTNGYNVSLVKWTGEPDKHTNKLFQSRNNDTVVMDANWTIEDTLFVDADPSEGDHTLTKTMTVPGDANNYAIMLYPVQAESPMSIAIKQLKLDVAVPFSTYFIKAPKLFNEAHFHYDETKAKFVQNNAFVASVRYTINDAADGLPMPVGVIEHSNPGMSLDSSVNIVPGSQIGRGEGAIKFEKAGSVTIDTDLLLWSEQAAGTTSDVTFWWNTVGPDGSLRKIDASETPFKVSGGLKNGQFRMKEFKIEVEAGDRIALRVKADKADGAYLMCNNPAYPLITVKLDYEELIPTLIPKDQQALDLTKADRIAQGDKFYTTSIKGYAEFAPASNVSIVFKDLPTNATPHVIGAYKKNADGVIQTVAKMESKFNKATSTLSVFFGETVETVVVYEVLA